MLKSLDAEIIIGSLARQLLQSTANFLLRDDLLGDDLSQIDFESVYRILEHALPANSQAYFILDGLDDCDLPTRNLVIEQLQKLQKIMTLHLCLSIRLDPAQNRSQKVNLGEPATAETVLMPDSNPDVEAFLDGELERRIESGTLKLGDPAIVLEIVRKLVEGSQGMFLWVALQLDTLCDMQTDDAIRQALDDLPKNVQETFTRILQKSGKSGEQGNTYQQRILELIVAAFRPLTTAELREVLSVVPGDIDWRPSSLINDIISLLAYCGGLVIVDEEDQMVRLVHHSFEQFLLGTLDGPTGGKFTMNHAHKNMAHSIITYLNYGIFGTELSSNVITRMEMGSAPSRIIQSSMDSSTGRSVALKLLNSRRVPNYDISKAIASARSRYETQSTEKSHFYAYAKSYCVDHVSHGLPEEMVFLKFLFRLESKNIINAAGGGTEYKRKLLLSAAKNGDETVVKLLLKAKADIKSVDPQYRQTPLSLASEIGYEAIVKLLLDADAEVEWTDGKDRTPLALAAKGGHEAVVKLLLKAKANIESVDREFCQTSLHRAARNGYEAIVKLLLEAKVEINLKNAYGDTPLSLATGKGQEAIFKLLLEASAELGPGC